MSPGKKQLLILISSLTILLSVSCDPNHHGKSYIRNESSYSLDLKFKTRYEEKNISIPPNSLIDVAKFSNIGAGRDYDCCACEFQTISIQISDTSKKLVKDINNNDNWLMNNPNTGKRKSSSQEISCEFIIDQADIK